MTLTTKRVREVLDYDPETGIFVWIKKPHYKANVRVGMIAGCLDRAGYVLIRIDGQSVRGHRLAWLYVYGYFPIEVDHRNGVRSDNKLLNLREATRGQNCANRGRPPCNTTGFKGVTRRGQQFVASIKKDRRRYHLGTFTTGEQAHVAYTTAAQQFFGEFANAG